MRYSFDIYNGAVRKLQEDDYYPFGLQVTRHIGTTPNKYLYNGKEIQDELKQYDYGARFYDPVIARWNVIDPMSELHYDLTPYNYVMNTPLLYADEFGMDTTRINLAPVVIVARAANTAVNGLGSRLGAYGLAGLLG